MQPVSSAQTQCAGSAVALTCLIVVAVAACSFEPQGEGRVVAVIDARTFRLQDGREVRLAGIEPVAGRKAQSSAALAAVIAGRDVALSGDDDSPDRYGRQPAFVHLAGSDTPVQSLLLAQGEALVSAEVTEKDCAAVLAVAEAEARRARRGTWADPAAIKNAESPGDILAGIGRWSRAKFCRSGRPGQRLT